MTYSSLYRINIESENKIFRGEAFDLEENMLVKTEGWLSLKGIEIWIEMQLDQYEENQ